MTLNISTLVGAGPLPENDNVFWGQILPGLVSGETHISIVKLNLGLLSNLKKNMFDIQKYIQTL